MNRLTPQCEVRRIKRVQDVRGDLCVVQQLEDVPFDIQRVFYVLGVPGGTTRGGHAHIRVWEGVIALTGAFTFVADDGVEKRRFRLERPDDMLILPPLHWLEMVDFEPGTSVLVLASGPHEDSDYLRTYDGFKAFLESQRS